LASEPSEFSDSAGSDGGREFHVLEPADLGAQGVATTRKRTEPRTAHRREIGEPSALRIGFDVRAARNRESTERGEVDGFGVEAADGAGGIDDELQCSGLILRDGTYESAGAR
jgi:hypothetical protein